MTFNLSIARKLALAFSLGPVISILLGGLIYSNTTELGEARKWVAHTREVLERAQLLATKLVDAETGERGYLLTGDDTYLEPYRAAVGQLDKEVNSLGALTADNPRQQARLLALRPMIATKLGELADAIQLRGEKGLDASLAVVRTNRGKHTMDAIRDALRDFSDDETALLKRRDDDAAKISQLTFDAIVYGTAFCVALLALVGFFVARSITGPVSQAVNALAAATGEILAGTTQQASGMEEQATAVAETVSTVDEIMQTAEQANERAKAVAETSRRAGDVSNAGRQAVGESVSVMGNVKDQGESIAQSILRLAEQAQAIGEIIAAVTDVAEQTNLLALNAAIEASRAGEHGRGFAVVAGEIKALADQSKKATSQVRQILGEIQKATNGAVMATEQGTKSIDEAIKTVNQAGTTIQQLADTIAESVLAATQITASVGQQAIGMAQIQQAMQSINQATNQSLASTRQAERAAQDLDQLGIRLKGLLTGAAA
jgi:methyl-accepting chemotaxis protein